MGCGGAEVPRRCLQGGGGGGVNIFSGPNFAPREEEGDDDEGTNKPTNKRMNE